MRSSVKEILERVTDVLEHITRVGLDATRAALEQIREPFNKLTAPLFQLPKAARQQFQNLSGNAGDQRPEIGQTAVHTVCDAVRYALASIYQNIGIAGGGQVVFQPGDDVPRSLCHTDISLFLIALIQSFQRISDKPGDVGTEILIHAVKQTQCNIFRNGSPVTRLHCWKVHPRCGSCCFSEHRQFHPQSPRRAVCPYRPMRHPHLCRPPNLSHQPHPQPPRNC